eukprot:CAMPEP_0167800904 /NCGR_PEP_ID=MMETSP0111_2-20121227/18068_1 /TAXON_ID=91324 /ORGANISM="Lotharella globosa, Strain CCCM811" /LENGTH=317 /DNA_ID=CAMNT_0007696371 /DNA_START=1 /DNA_END=954 /DNA_ORIENTATION=+
MEIPERNLASPEGSPPRKRRRLELPFSPELRKEVKQTQEEILWDPSQRFGDDQEQPKRTRRLQVKKPWRDKMCEWFSAHCWLFFERNELDFIPVLELQQNSIRRLPKEIGKLYFLKRFYVNNNQLRHLPMETGGLKHLEVLDLSGNNLKDLPAQIGGLESIRSLGLRSNCLVSLPPTIGRLTSLQILDLDGNKLTSLPKEIGNLSSLLHAKISFNDLRKIPVEIISLKSLVSLRIRGNKLEELPLELGGLRSLRRLDVRDNPGLETPFPTVPAKKMLCHLQRTWKAQNVLTRDTEGIVGQPLMQKITRVVLTGKLER